MKIKKKISLILIFTMLICIFTNVYFYKIAKAQKQENNSKKYVINIVWDGLSSYMFNKLKVNGIQTPNIDSLINNGTKLDKVSTTIPSYGGAQAALVTGAYPKTTDFLYRYYDKNSNTIKNTSGFSGQTVFENINFKNPELKTLALGINVAGTTLNGRGVNKTSDPNYDGKHTLVEYAMGDNLINFNTVSTDIINAINSAPDDMPDYLLAYSNDIKMLYWNKSVSDQSKFEQSIASEIEALDSKLGDIINALKAKGIYKNTIIILNSLSSTYAVPNKMPNIATNITIDTGIKAEYTSSNPALDTKVVIVKTYIMKYAQLSFTNNATQEDKEKVLNYLNDKTSNAGKLIKQILNPADFNAPANYADYLIDPLEDYTFSAASIGYERTDNLDDMNQFCIVSGIGVIKRASVDNANIVDIASNISFLLGITPPDNNEGNIWNIFDFISPQLEVTLDGEKDADGNYKSQILISALASDNSGQVNLQYDIGNGYENYTEPFYINNDCILKVRAVDNAGNEVEKVYNLNFTKLIGIINFVGDTDTVGDIIVTDSESIDVCGSVLNADNSLKITVNDEETQLNNNSFEKIVNLKNGKNTISVKATLNGITNVQNKIIYRAYKPNITSINDGAIVSDPQVDVGGDVVPGSLVSINGVTVSVDSNGIFTTHVDLVEGQNNIKIMSTIGKYNKETDFIIYYYKSSNIIINSPKDLQVVTKNLITVSGIVDNNCIVKVNGNTVTLKDGNTFCTDVKLNKGINIIRIDADNHGVITTKTIKVDYVDPNDDYVVYINWDGFARYYYDLANQGETSRTPVINELIKHGIFFENAYTGIPSITGAMQPAIVSGAWPATTGNAYRYYDKEKNVVIQFDRENKAETIAEAAVRQGLKVASIHQFALENRGTVAGDPDKPYITAGDSADYAARFDAAIKLIKGQTVGQGTSQVQLDEIPRFIAIYIDDLDAFGHNEVVEYGVPVVYSEDARKEKVLNRLQQMDEKLGEFIQACKDRGIYDNMTFVLTTDHGMAPFGQQDDEPDDYGYSKLPDLINTITNLGYKVEVLFGNQSPKSDTDIVIVDVGLEAQLSFTKDYDKSDIDKIINAVKDKPYVGNIMEKNEMTSRGVIKGYADLLISPKPPYSFKTKSNPNDPDKLYIARGQHDSLDETAQHIFSIMWGKGVKRGYKYEDRIYNIDFARTMAKLLSIDGPKDATGRVLSAALMNNTQNSSENKNSNSSNNTISNFDKIINNIMSIISNNSLNVEQFKEEIKNSILPIVEPLITVPSINSETKKLKDGSSVQFIEYESLSSTIQNADNLLKKLNIEIKDDEKRNIIQEEIGKINILLNEAYNKNIGIGSDIMLKLDNSNFSLNLQYPDISLNIDSDILPFSESRQGIIINVAPITDANVLNIQQLKGNQVGNAYNISISQEVDGWANKIIQLNQNITLTFKLDDKELEGIIPSTLKVYKQDEQTGEFVELEGTYISEQYALKVNTNHLCNFIIIGGKSIERIFGNDRYQTAVAISQREWENGSDSVVLVNGEEYADALSGVIFSKFKNAPILLTNKDKINPFTLKEIERLNPKYVYILGGEMVVSKNVEVEIQKYNPVRLYGIDRFNTAIEIGEKIRREKNFDTVILVKDSDFADALSIASYSSKNMIPILFTSSDNLNPDTEKAITNWNIKNVLIIGGLEAVSNRIEQYLKNMKINVMRISGEDRYKTSIETARYFNNEYNLDGVIIATGNTFSDALTGSSFAIKGSCTILLTDKDIVKSDLIDYINRSKVKYIYILGGPQAISDDVFNKISTWCKAFSLR